LWQESAGAAFTPLLPEGYSLPEPPPGRWRGLLADPGVTMLVAEDGGDMLGFATCGVSRDPDAGPDTGEVRTFFVAAGHWRRGIGRALMAAALADLRERGYAEATVWSFEANVRANAFYEAQGFVPDGTERAEEIWGNVPEIRYRRALA
jgi:GNAT superfamily N-acetyltransferase